MHRHDTYSSDDIHHIHQWAYVYECCEFSSAESPFGEEAARRRAASAARRRALCADLCGKRQAGNRPHNQSGDQCECGCDLSSERRRSSLAISVWWVTVLTPATRVNDPSGERDCDHGGELHSA